MNDHPRRQNSKENYKMTKQVTAPLTEKDHEIIMWLVEFLGCSRSEALRTCIRAFAGQMKALDKDMRIGKKK